MKEFVSIDILKQEELKLEELKKVNGGIFVPPGHTIGIIATDLPE